MDNLIQPETVRRIAMLGNHLPRQCGIATFTTDLSDAIASEYRELDCFVLAMNDAGKRYAYPSARPVRDRRRRPRRPTGAPPTS